MKPILFENNEREFKTQGFGVLSDAVECLVTEERNGIFEAEMQYPETGIHFSEIQNDRIILVKPSPYKLPQPFRIYRITKPLGGIVSVYARHITYDLNGIPIDPFTAGNAPEAMDGLKQHSAITHPFTFWTDKTTAAEFKSELPATIRSVLGGKAGSILDVYGGEYEWDNFTIKLHDKRGQDNGVVIRYGKNLTNIEQDENISNLYTGIYPFWKDNDGNLVTANPKVIEAEGTFPFSRIIPIDFSSDFQEKPNPQQLTEKGKEYIKANKVGVPTVSVKVEFVPLEQTEEYKDISLLERCDLCDTVTVQFPKLGIDVKAKIVKGIYNALADRWESVEIGEAKTNITDTIIQQGNDIEHKIPGVGEIQGIVDKITGEILGAKGGAVRILDNDGDGALDTLYIADHEDPNLAKKVWRFNYEGWGASKNGYNGPFTMAASIETGFYADFITGGVLNASLIKAGILKSIKGDSFYLDLLTGELRIKALDGKADKDKIISEINVSKEGIKIAADKLNISGFVTFNDLKQKGKTTINGGNITTGIIEGVYIYQNNGNGTGAELKNGQLWLYNNGKYMGRLYAADIDYGYCEIQTTGKHFGLANDTRFELIMQANTHQIDVTNLYVEGRLTGGRSAAIAQTWNYSNRELPYLAGTEDWIIDCNESQIQNGYCKIEFDKIFKECANTTFPYQIILTPNEKGQVYVSERAEDYFIVSGDSVSFSWLIFAKRREYENGRMMTTLDISNVKTSNHFVYDSNFLFSEPVGYEHMSEKEQNDAYFEKYAEFLTREERSKSVPDVNKILKEHGILKG